VNPKTNRNHGKAAERAFAKYLGAQRMGVMGRHDIQGGIYAAEVKSYTRMVAFTWWEQAVRNAATKGLTPMLLLHLKGTEYRRGLV